MRHRAGQAREAFSPAQQADAFRSCWRALLPQCERPARSPSGATT